MICISVDNCVTGQGLIRDGGAMGKTRARVRLSLSGRERIEVRDRLGPVFPGQSKLPEEH